jgi:hypothetical protein
MVALAHESLAAIAPTYESMRKAIAECLRVDEVKHIADVAVAAKAYYRQSLDVENEMRASRIRLRAERRMGELLIEMKQRGERAKRGETKQDRMSRRATFTLPELGIPRDRASRAEQLARVPAPEFEAALGAGEPGQPRRIIREWQEKHDVTPEEQLAPELVPIEHTLALWGRVREFGELLDAGELPPLDLWRTNIQPFQIAQLQRHIPPIIEYLTAVYRDIEQGAA